MFPRAESSWRPCDVDAREAVVLLPEASLQQLAPQCRLLRVGHGQELLVHTESDKQEALPSIWADQKLMN